MHALALAVALGMGVVVGDVAVHRDLVYGEDPALQSLDVFAPAQSPKPRPLVIFVHGGGWSEGDKGRHVRKGMWFVRQGFVYASVNYRLSPAVRHPSHAEDVARAVAWLRAHAARFGADPERVYLLGHSAGAHLVALVATDVRLLASHGERGHFLRGVILLDGSGYDLTVRVPKARPPSQQMFLQAFGEDPSVWKDASPVHHAGLSRVPPPLLLFYVAGRKSSQTQARLFSDRLRKVGGEAHLVGVAGRDHVSIVRRLGLPGDPVGRRLLRFIRMQEGAAP